MNPTTPPVPVGAEPVVLENDVLRIGIDASSGHVVSLVNRATGHEIIDPDAIVKPPWRVQLADIDPAIHERRTTLRGAVTGKTELVLHFMKEIVGGDWTDQYESFSVSDSGDGSIALAWTRGDGIEVRARVALAAGDGELEMRAHVVNGSDRTVLALEYPIIDGIRPLGDDSSTNRLAHSVDGGFLFEDPHRLFRDERIIEAWKRRGIVAGTSPNGHPDEGSTHGGLFRVRGYPNGFEGAPMQFWAFYDEGTGGFSFATHDPHGTEKNFHFYVADRRDVLTSSVVHHSWDWTPGGDLVLDYPFVVGALTTGTWFEAADRYRGWVTGEGEGNPDWCRRGTLRQRVAEGTASRWLTEEVGFNTFGVPISADMSAWYRAFHDITGGPVLHIVGHDWEDGAVHIRPESWDRLRELLAPNDPNPSLHELSAVLGIEPVPEELPRLREILLRFRKHLWGTFHVEPYQPEVTFDPANLEVFAETGDRLVPFLWRDFIGLGHDTERYGCLVPITPFTNAFMCPTTDYWREWHARDDVALVEAGVDGIYYDVSASCATPTICLNRGHDHPIGFGRHMIDAYADVFRHSQEAAHDAGGRDHLPVGTEVIIENLVGVLDYAQCRAGAGVQATMEGEEFVEWQVDGRAHKIPMFAYVFHEYGPVLLDGWAKLSRRFGEVFYEIAARVALEGGLLQLNYEFSPLELFADMDGSAFQLVYTNQLREVTSPETVDEAKLDFIREIAAARTDFAVDFLAYGRMIPSLPLGDVGEVTLDWEHYNSWHGLRLERGVLRRSAVVHVAWASHDGRLGYVFVNLHADHPLTVPIVPDLSPIGGASSFTAEVVGTSGRRSLGTRTTGDEVAVELPPRRVILVEVSPR